MKRILRYTVALVGLVAAFGCRKEEDVEIDVYPIQISATPEGKEVNVSINSTSSWNVVASDEWITVSPSTGSGAAKIKVIVAPYKENNTRRGSVNVLSASGKVSATIGVSQKGGVDNIIIAHRGVYAEFGLPGNSLASLNKAIELGLYGSECDINVTSDGQVIVVHGESFNGLAVYGHTYAELKARGKLTNGEELPLLRSFIEAAMNGYGTKLFIDVKSLSDAAGGNDQSVRAGVAAAKLIKEMGAQKYVCFIIGRIVVFNGVVGEVGGQWPVGYMNSGITPEKFKSLVAGNTAWANFDIGGISEDPATGKFSAAYADTQLRKWNDAGIEVSVYNIDTEEQIQWYLPHKDNVKACSNYPVALMKRVGKL